MQFCLTKLSVNLEIDPYVISLDASLLQIKEIVRIYANPKYLDRNVRWVLFILAEYTCDAVICC